MKVKFILSVFLSVVVLLGSGGVVFTLMGCDDCEEEGTTCTEDEDCCSDDCKFYSEYHDVGYCK